MYYIVYGILYAFSLLPMAVLYLFSDLAFFILYHLSGYRKKVVMDNLERAFPEKSPEERKKIAKQFYHHFTDTFIESLKLISAGKKFLDSHATGDMELINDLAARGYNINLMAAHQFNWEYVNLYFSAYSPIPFVGIYMPLNNKIFDRIFLKMRGKFGSNLVSAQQFKHKRNEVFRERYMLALAADQNPGNPANSYWIKFMGHPAPFVMGPAKGAVLQKAAIVMTGMHRVSRGKYHFSVHLIMEDVTGHSPQELTVLYKNALEKVINEDPSNYLWSHRRWKHAWKPEYGAVME